MKLKWVPATHTILFGAEIIDTTNNNLRYNTYFSNTKDDNEVFNITRSYGLYSQCSWATINE